MAHTTPSVSNGRLTYFQHGIPHTFPVGSDAWWQWLVSGVRCFRVQGVEHPFTMRREQQMYWRAYCTHDKHKYLLYVGKTETLTLYRLHEVAQELCKRIAPDTYALEQNKPSLAVVSLPEVVDIPLDATVAVPQRVPMKTLPHPFQDETERPFFVFDAMLMQRLTTRETEVMKVVAERMTNIQIADQIHISMSTVKAHVSSICEKLELANCVQVIMYAQRIREQKMVTRS